MDWWIKLHRKILDNPISYSIELFAIMGYMLLKANHTDATIYLWLNKIELKAWQFISSQRKIADRFWLPISKVHRIIKVLWDEWILKHEWNTKYTIFTILNWDIYQWNEIQVKHQWNTSETKKETDNNNNNINNNKNILSKDNIIYTPKNNFDYSFVDEFLNKEHPTIKYQIQKEWLDIYLWKQYEVVDKLIKDWFTLEQIQLSCLFIKQDDFWKKNILTIKKLRQKNKDWVPYIVVILWKAKDFIEEKQNRTYQKTFLYGDWQNYVSN